MPRTSGALIAAVILAFAAARGIQRVLTGILLADMDPWTITTLSLLVATALWLPIAAVKRWLPADRALWWRSIPLGLVNIAIPGIAFTAAQQYVTASTAALLVAMLPVLVAVLAAVLLHERLTPRAVLGIGVATAGLLILALGRGGALDGTNWWAGLALVAAGVISAAFVYVGWRTLLSRYPAVVLLAPQLVISTVAVAPFALLEHGTLPTPGEWWTVGALAAVNYVIPQLAMFWLLTRTTALQATLPSYGAPLIAALIAWPVLDQPVTVVVAAGGALILLGAWLINRGRLT